AWNKEKCLEKLNEIKDKIDEKEYKKMEEHMLNYTCKHWKTRCPFCGKDGCGYLTVCDDCLGMTTNGQYDVGKILESTIEYKEDGKEDDKKDAFANITCEMFIDKKIEEICEELDGYTD